MFRGFSGRFGLKCEVCDCVIWTGTKAIKSQAMAMAACQAQCVQQSLNYLAQGTSSLEVRNRPATVSFTRTATKNVDHFRTFHILSFLHPEDHGNLSW